MKISVCIPQYNRIEFLKINLDYIARQKYPHVEVVISDDASADDTEAQITTLSKGYPFPILYYRFQKNQGYDRNLRKSLELATGDYCFILGNDDTLSDEGALQRLADFLQQAGQPEVGFCNSVDFFDRSAVQERATATAVIGTGYNIALKYYSSFSFVAGIIYKKSAFDAVNTAAFDKSVYVQIYLAIAIIAQGGRLFTYKEPLVLSNIRVQDTKANAFRDTIPRAWKDYKKLDGGLPSYAGVTYKALQHFGDHSKAQIGYNILNRIYKFTYPYWLLNYRKDNAFVSSVGMIEGLQPKSFDFYKELRWGHKLKINSAYALASVAGIVTPLFLFDKLKERVYRMAKR